MTNNRTMSYNEALGCKIGDEVVWLGGNINRTYKLVHGKTYKIVNIIVHNSIKSIYFTILDENGTRLAFLRNQFSIYSSLTEEDML